MSLNLEVGAGLNSYGPSFTPQTCQRIKQKQQFINNINLLVWFLFVLRVDFSATLRVLHYNLEVIGLSCIHLFTYKDKVAYVQAFNPPQT